MKKIRRTHDQAPFAYPDDVERIVQAFANIGLEATPEQANELWLDYSDSMCAGWMTLNGETDDYIIASCMPFFEVLDDENEYRD